MKKILLSVALVAFSYMSSGQSKVAVIPEPVYTEVLNGNFELSPKAIIELRTKDAATTAAYFNSYLKKYYGFSLKTSSDKGNIVLDVNPSLKLKEGAYELKIIHSQVLITSADASGLFNGIQTFIQLLPVDATGKKLILANVSIKDEPRFGYRGAMLDCGRHFMPVDFVKQYIDYLALHKFNVFHWHLTDDQGWRIEIKKYPKLTQVGAWRNGTIIGHHPGTGNDSVRTGGYYTQEQIKDIVKYAAARYITIIPEIEMPGHSSAAIAAYPELSCFPKQSTDIGTTPWAGTRNGKQVQQTWGVFDDVYVPTEYTFHFLEEVLSEVFALFPSKLIHIGGDECPKDYWKKSEFCQNLMKEKGLKNEEELQSYFIHRIEKFVNSKGRNIIGWDEILEGGLAPNATIMSWRGMEGGIAAAKQHHNVIMTPSSYVYLDHAQLKEGDSLTIGGYLPVKTVYSFDPVPKTLTNEEQKYILGGQGNLWTEYVKGPSKAEYMIFPRLSALSEALWTPVSKKDLNQFYDKLDIQKKRYDKWGINYCKWMDK